VEVGLYGNPFVWNYEKMRVHDTTRTLFQDTWEMVFHLGIHIQIQEPFHIGPVREGDSALMRLCAEVGFKEKHVLNALNVVRRFKTVLQESDLLCCNGRTIDWGFALLWEQELLTYNHFPKEDLRAKDFALWEMALRSLTGRRDAMPI
jgi:hypothetical protein